MLFGVTGGFEANLVLGMQVGVQCCQRRTHVMGRSEVLGEAPTRQGPCGRRQQQRGGPVVCRWGQPRGLPTRSGHIRDTSSDCGFRARSKAHPPQLCQPGGHQCDAAWMGQWPSPVPLLDPGAGRRRPGRRSLPSPTAAWGRARVEASPTRCPRRGHPLQRLRGGWWNFAFLWMSGRRRRRMRSSRVEDFHGKGGPSSVTHVSWPRGLRKQ